MPLFLHKCRRKPKLQFVWLWAQSICSAQNSCWGNRATFITHSCWWPAYFWIAGIVRPRIGRWFIMAFYTNIKGAESLPVGGALVVPIPWLPPGSILFILRASSGWLKRKKADWPKHSMHPARREELSVMYWLSFAHTSINLDLYTRTQPQTSTKMSLPVTGFTNT